MLKIELKLLSRAVKYSTQVEQRSWCDERWKPPILYHKQIEDSQFLIFGKNADTWSQMQPNGIKWNATAQAKPQNTRATGSSE